MGGAIEPVAPSEAPAEELEDKFNTVTKRLPDVSTFKFLRLPELSATPINVADGGTAAPIKPIVSFVVILSIVPVTHNGSAADDVTYKDPENEPLANTLTIVGPGGAEIGIL